MLQGAAGPEPPRDGTAGASGGGGGRDRISDLPDELRHRIFSFMPAWEVVRTSALSRQWRHLWASAPCLDIHYPCGCDGESDQDWHAKFVTHLLLLRRMSEPLDTLRLHWNHDDADTWIEHALRRNARAIELSAERHRPMLEPEYSIFLHGNLKILQLSYMRLNNEALSQLCSRCTSLEELQLKNVDIYAMDIRSTSLKRLTMLRCFNRHGLSVDAPNLVLLRCIRPHNFVPRIQNSGSLFTATIMLDDNCLQQRHATCRTCAEAEDPRHSESQAAAHCNGSTTGSEAEDLADSESQSEPDDDSSPDSHTEDIGGNSDGVSIAGSDAEDPDTNDDDGEIADVYSGEDDNNAAGSDAGDRDDDDDDDKTADVYSSEDEGYYGALRCGGHGLLRSLSNVVTLNLSANSGQLVLMNELEKNCPEFRSLRTLSVGEWCIHPGFNPLSTMLANSPNLENLFIHLQAFSSSDYPRERPFTCNNLKVKISYATRDGMAVHQLEDFLRSSYGSMQKRKALGEAANSPGKQRKVRSPEGGQGGRN